MSLQVEGHRRGRSRSPGGRERTRSRGPASVIDVDPGHDDGDRTYGYDDRYYKAPPSPEDDYYRRPRSPAVENGARTSYADLREHRRDSPRERLSDSDRERLSDRDREKAKTGSGLADAFLPQKYAKKLETSDAYNLLMSPLSDRSRDKARDRRAEKKEKLQEDLAYGKPPWPSSKDVRPLSPRPLSPGPLSPPSPYYDYADTSQHSYEDRDHRDSYFAEPKRSSDMLGVGHVRSGRSRSRSRSRSDVGRERPADGRDKKHSHKHSHSHSHAHSHTRHESLTAEPADAPRKSALKRNSSPQPPVAKMSSLSVNTAYNAGSLSAAPPSPLLESYHGTYQSMSPMPSPMLLPTQQHTVMDVAPLDSDDDSSSGGGKKRQRRARFANPEDDAQRLADALKGHKAPKIEPLLEILPGLTHDQVMDIRAEYKRLVKTGPEKKGVNVAKHIRVRLKDEDPSLMKACYATALGQWESEAYWSSFWYQGDKTRRELLIESLMGRTNDEVHQIKESFNDKTYDNSLTRCMKHELKEDKFKKAVLLVLEEKRMEDVDKYGRELPIDPYLVEDDVGDLRNAVKADKGGESAMISIVVKRSDSHLREILKVYNEKYGSNFARDALRKSGNLVVSSSS